MTSGKYEDKNEFQHMFYNVACALKSHLLSKSTPAIIMTGIKGGNHEPYQIVQSQEEKKKREPAPSCHMYVKILNPSKFAKIRKARSVANSHFVEELMKPLKILGTLGKSGSTLAFSASQHYIVKTIPEDEAKHLRKLLPAFVKYVCNAPNERGDDLIEENYKPKAVYTSQVLFLCKLTYYDTRMQSMKMKVPIRNVYFTVQESCYPMFPHPNNKPLIFDLKGSWVGRTTKYDDYSSQSQSTETSTSSLAPGCQLNVDPSSSENDPPLGIVLKDNNLQNILKRNPKWLDFDTSKSKFQASVWESHSEKTVQDYFELKTPEEVYVDLMKDAYFLSRFNCIDYSLMLAIFPLSADILSSQTNNNNPQENNFSICAPPVRVQINGVPHVAFIRIIDTLCPWSVKKQVARMSKVLVKRMPKKGLSTAPPDWYAKRFVEMCNNLLQPTRTCPKPME